MNYKYHYSLQSLELVVKLESVCDKKGNVKFRVQVANGLKENESYLFSHLSSAIDFITNNFQ